MNSPFLHPVCFIFLALQRWHWGLLDAAHISGMNDREETRFTFLRIFPPFPTPSVDFFCTLSDPQPRPKTGIGIALPRRPFQIYLSMQFGVNMRPSESAFRSTTVRGVLRACREMRNLFPISFVGGVDGRRGHKISFSPDSSDSR